MRGPDADALLQHAGFVRALARALLRDPHAAEDVVQETWLAALQSPPRHRANLRGWLGVVARNLALRRRRAEDRRSQHEQGSPPPGGLPSPEEMAARMELQRRIVDAIDQLDEIYRTTLIYRYLDDLKPAEIAARTGQPVKTVKTRLSRALEQLRARLDREAGGRRAWTALLVPLAFPRGTAAATGSGLLAGLTVFTMKKALAFLALLILATGLLLWSGWGEENGSEPRTTAQAGTPAGLPAADPPAPESTPSSDEEAAPLHDVPGATFAGRVVDEAGRGVPGATVELIYWHVVENEALSNGPLSVLRRARERLDLPATVTDAEGGFLLRRPYPSRSYLRVRAPGYVTTITGPREPSGSIEVELKRGHVAKVRVVDPDQQPVSGARVEVVALTRFAGDFYGSRAVLDVATTDERGEAALANDIRADVLLAVDPGRADLGQVEAKGPTVVVPRVPARTIRVVDADAGRPLADAFVLVFREDIATNFWAEASSRRLDADDDGSVRVPVQKGYRRWFVGAPGHEVRTVSGDLVRLRPSLTVAGIVLDPSGRPVADADLLVASGRGVFDRVYAGLSPIAGRSGADGRFLLEIRIFDRPYAPRQPEPGLRSLVALHPRWGVAFADSIPLQSGRTENVRVRFEEPGLLEIRVMDGRRGPVADQVLEVYRRVPRADSWSEKPFSFGVDPVVLREPALLRTDRDGHCLVEGLAPGSYVVRVGESQTETSVTSGVRSRVEVVKGAGLALRGRLLKHDGEPWPGVLVYAARASAQTDASGCFVFDIPEPGEQEVRFLLPFGHLCERIRPGEEVAVRAPAGPARLRIVAEGAGDAKIEYTLRTLSGHMEHRMLPLKEGGETGIFTPGRGIVILSAKGHAWTAATFDAKANEITEVRVSLPPAGSVSGSAARPGTLRLEREDGLPIPLTENEEALRSFLLRHARRQPLQAALDASGRVRIDNVAPGAYRAILVRDGEEIASRRVIVLTGVDTAITFD